MVEGNFSFSIRSLADPLALSAMRFLCHDYFIAKVLLLRFAEPFGQRERARTLEAALNGSRLLPIRSSPGKSFARPSDR